MRINPFDDDNGSFFVLVNDEEQHGPIRATVNIASSPSRSDAAALG